MRIICGRINSYTSGTDSSRKMHLKSDLPFFGRPSIYLFFWKTFDSLQFMYSGSPYFLYKGSSASFGMALGR